MSNTNNEKLEAWLNKYSIGVKLTKVQCDELTKKLIEERNSQPFMSGEFSMEAAQIAHEKAKNRTWLGKLWLKIKPNRTSKFMKACLK